MLYRIFYIRHTLSQKEEQKLREHRKKPMDGQVTIRYTRKRCSEDIELSCLTDARKWIEDQTVMLPGMEGVRQSFVTVFEACEARNGEKVTELEGVFSATEVLLPL